MAYAQDGEPPDATYVCMEHERVEVNMICLTCQQYVCGYCVDRHLGSMCKLKKLMDLTSGEISAFSNKPAECQNDIDPATFEDSALSNKHGECSKENDPAISEISALAIKLGERQKEIDTRIISVNDMENQACEELDIQLHRMDEERGCLLRQKSLVTKRAKAIKEGLEKERDEIYALRLQSQTISSFHEENYDKADLEKLQKNMNAHVKAQFPHQRLFKDLRSKVDKILSSHLELLASSPGGLAESLLCRVSKEINPHKYTSIGIALGIPNTTLERIKINHPHNIGDAIFKVLQEWNRLKADFSPANQLEELRTALRGEGEVDVADRLLGEPALEQNEVPADVDVPERATRASASSMNERLGD